MNVKNNITPFKIKTLKITDSNSKLTISKSSNYSVEIEDLGSNTGYGLLSTGTVLTLTKATSLKTRGVKQAQDSTVNLPDVTTLNAGKWLVTKNATLNLNGTDGDFRFKDGINMDSGLDIANSSIVVDSANSFYSQGLQIQNLNIHADTININGNFRINDGGTATINPNSAARVTMKANADVRFGQNSTIYLAPGDYYFQNLIIESNVKVIPTGTGTVRIFAYSSFTDSSTSTGMKMNEGEDPSKLLLYVKNGVKLMGNTKISALIISEGQVELANTGAAVNGAIISGNNTILSTGTSVTYDGRVKNIDSGSTQTECVYPATGTDICYDSLSYSGLFCVDFGLVQGGFNCKQTIPLRNVSSESLSNVKAVIDTTGASGSFLSSCGVDGTNSGCTQNSAVNVGPFGILNNNLVFTISDTDYASGETHTVSDTSLLSMAIFSGTNLYATYTKNGVVYSAQISACPAVSDLTLTNIDSLDPVTTGGTVTYTLTVTNNGPTRANNVRITDTVSAGGTLQSASGTGWSCSQSGLTVTCTGVNLDVGTSSSVLITVTAPTTAGTIQNSATVISDSADNNPADNTDIIQTTAVQTLDQPNVQCGIFPGVLTSYSGISTGGNTNSRGCGTTTISYPSGTFSGDPMECFETSCPTGNGVSGSSCQRSDVPNSRYTVAFPSLPLSPRIIASDTTLSPNQSYTGSSSSDYASFGDVTITGNSGTTVTFTAGDYYFNSLSVPDNNTHIVITGTVRIFVKNDLVFSANSYEINKNGLASNLIFYVGGNLDFEGNGGGNGGMNAYFYVKGTTTVNNNTNNWMLTGGITSEGVVTISGQNPSFINYTNGAGDDYGVCLSVGFEQADYQTFEDLTLPFGSASTLMMRIVLSRAVDYPVTVNYATQDMQAIGGSDYLSQSAAITIPAHSTFVDIPMYIIHDEPIELDEAFQVVLSNPQPSTVPLGINPATVTIGAQDTAPMCYSDNFNSGTATGNNWRVLKSSGTYTPGYVNNRMQLTDAVGNRATAITKDYEFSASQNLIIAEFTHYAYGGNGADGMALVLYDSSVGATPTVGAFGGSLGYAQKSNPGSDCTVSGGCPGFQGGWIGLGIDEYGNYSNPSEGRIGGPGFTSDAVAIRGKGSGQSGYKYLAGTGTLTPSIDASGTTPKPGDKFRMTVDARDTAHLYIKLERDTGSGYVPVISQFDAIASQGASPSYVRLAFTASTGGSNNIHEIDDMTVYGNCTLYNASMSGAFRVTEDTSASAWNVKWPKKLINTQVAPLNSKRFCVLAGTSGNDSATPLTSDVSVDINLTNNAGYNQTIISNLTIPAGSSQACFDVNYSSAAQMMQFVVAQHTTGAMTSYSDTFAIRPNTFIFDVNASDITKLFAGQTYQLDINANSLTSDNAVAGYTTTLGTLTANTVATKVLSPTMASCPVSGTENLSLVFNNGQATLGNFMYDNVMDINVTVVDGNWTGTDQSNGGCTPGTDSTVTTPVGCLVKGLLQVRFVPHHFDLAAEQFNYNKGVFSYLSNPKIVGSDYNMSAGLDVNITAKTALNNVATYYNASCYAKSKDVSLEYTPTSVNNLSQMWCQYGYNNVLLGDINQTVGSKVNMNFPIAVFSADHNGSAQLHFKLNFDRDNAKPVSPFLLDVTKVDVNNTDEVNATMNPSGTSLYVYGRS
ncbi:MAG: Calx-beta domain-containing protein, partial [Sulfuricurvum sp.]